MAAKSLTQPYPPWVGGGWDSLLRNYILFRFHLHMYDLEMFNLHFGVKHLCFRNVFDPRQMRISVQGSGIYLNRERGCK